MILACTLAWALSFGRRAPEPEPAPPPPPVEVPALEVGYGSLFDPERGGALTGVAGNSLRPGDLVTVLVDEAMQSQIDAQTNTSASREVSFGVDALLGVDTQILGNNSSMGESISLGFSGDSKHAGTGEVARSNRIVSTITCTVTEVTPNGNVRLQGVKRIGVNYENQFLALRGVVRARDISTDNTVVSWRIGDVEIDVGGRGVVNDKQRVGFAQRLTDTISP